MGDSPLAGQFWGQTIDKKPGTLSACPHPIPARPGPTQHPTGHETLKSLGGKKHGWGKKSILHLQPKQKRHFAHKPAKRKTIVLGVTAFAELKVRKRRPSAGLAGRQPRKQMPQSPSSGPWPPTSKKDHVAMANVRGTWDRPPWHISRRTAPGGTAWHHVGITQKN